MSAGFIKGFLVPGLPQPLLVPEQNKGWNALRQAFESAREEIEASDPVLYAEWDGKVEGFEYPGGEARADFRARVEQGLEGLQTGGATSVLVVAHKGTVRTIAESLLGAPLEDGEPPLAGSLGLFCAADDDWRLGRRGSNPG